MPKLIDNVRETILAKGKEMLLAEDYRAFNIRNLAKSCNIALGTFYNYFENKEVLAYQIFSNDWNKTLELVNRLQSEELPVREKLRRLYNTLELFLSQYFNIFKEMAVDGRRGNTHDRYIELHGRLTSLILEEQKAGRIHNNMEAEKLSYFIMSSMINAICLKHLTFDEMFECIRI